MMREDTLNKCRIIETYIESGHTADEAIKKYHISHMTWQKFRKMRRLEQANGEAQVSFVAPVQRKIMKRKTNGERMTLIMGTTSEIATLLKEMGQ